MEVYMEAFKIVLSVAQFLGALFLIVVILLQQGKRAGLSGAISGMADTFLSKNKARTWDAKLAKLTVLIAVLFMVITFSLSFI